MVNACAFLIGVNVRSSWLAAERLAFPQNQVTTPKGKAFTNLIFSEEELENEMPILNKYAPESTSNKPLQVVTKPNIHSYREMLPWRKRNMQR